MVAGVSDILPKKTTLSPLPSTERGIWDVTLRGSV